MNKIITAVTISAITLFGLSACGSESSANPTVTVTESAPAPAPEPVLTEEDMYIDNLRSFGNEYVTLNTDEDLINLGYILCGELDAGFTVYEIIEDLAYSGDFDTNDQEAIEFAGLVIGASVRDLCPEYAYQIEGMM